MSDNPDARLTLALTRHHLAILRLGPNQPIPRWLDLDRPFFALTRSAEELSIVCDEAQLPDGMDDAECSRGWRAFRVNGPLDFSLTGVLASIATPLAMAKISLFAISTFDTDYILVRTTQLGAARDVLAREFNLAPDA